ncbi:HesA/MoeB/ThiF family protein, partial [Halobium palmae]
DDDAVERSNLQRQVVHADADVGVPKAESAKAYVERLNPDVTVEAHETRLDTDNVGSLVDDCDVVVDASDNFRTRYIVNDAARLAAVPVAHGAIYKFEGQATTLVPGGPCYRCLFPEAPEPGEVPDCATTGVLGVLPGVLGTIQATEAVKLLLGAGEPLEGRLLFYDALEMSFETVPYRRNPDCPVCGDDPIDGIDRVEYTGGCGIAN